MDFRNNSPDRRIEFTILHKYVIYPSRYLSDEQVIEKLDQIEDITDRERLELEMALAVDDPLSIESSYSDGFGSIVFFVDDEEFWSLSCGEE